MNANLNEVKTVENNAEETLKEVQKLNAKDVAITTALGAAALAVGVVVFKAVKDKKIEFKNPFAKKTPVETAVEEAKEVLDEVAEA